ncbi:DNA-directed RNA polymerase subunit E'' [Palaeococcus pacificus DY20341]|uniref:Transcription elongation factor Spt4 n=1 Tax=Palaeococcus pacificus DY20341 TaxID=1343739 RepID=A0A075LPL5_9EURY|nr:transcription elongation factor subunit Spt4 [Palaeococcus pacificus]AIF68600.1 DNA-directed RNA polymerase subunit E'' [Palaeococcus pacificus DY20341]
MIRACRHCHHITTEDQCPVCGSRDLSNEWFDLVIILDPEKSRIAESLKVSVEGKYAIRVR